jgi:hypothetical protein
LNRVIGRNVTLKLAITNAIVYTIGWTAAE